MADPRLHFRIRLDPEHAHLDGPLRREINRRWMAGTGTATCDIAHADEGFRLEVVGWPAHNESIRAYLLDLIRNGGWLVP